MSPPHSLLDQSQHATEAKLAVNGDGFGFSWYDERQANPGLYRDVLPAWSDGNLTSLCRMICAPLYIAHVRASTTGETARSNCHPFAFENWSFCHNGQLGGFSRLRRRMEEALPDALYAHRRGTTDSEMLFLTLLANGLSTDPEAALNKTLNAIKINPSEPPNRITLVFSDGARLFAFRHGSDNIAPTLYRRDTGAGVTLASEPLDGTAEGWQAIPQNHLVEL